jgi:hypothetical protein
MVNHAALQSETAHERRTYFVRNLPSSPRAPIAAE